MAKGSWLDEAEDEAPSGSWLDEAEDEITPVKLVKDGVEEDFDPNDDFAIKDALSRGYDFPETAQNREVALSSSAVKTSPLEAFGGGVASGASAGWLDEAAAMLKGGDYGKNLEAIRYVQDKMAQQNPVSNIAGNIAGSIAVPGMGAARASSILGRIGAGAALGGVQGGIQGAGESREADRSSDAITGALLGSMMGGALGPLARPVSSAKEVAKKAPPTIRAFKTGAAEGSKKVAEHTPGGDMLGIGHAIQAAGGLVGGGLEVMEQGRTRKELARIAGQPWPGMSQDWGDASIIGAKALAGGEFDNVPKYLAKQASAMGVPEEQYLKFLQMSPEQLERVAEFQKREAAGSVSPLLKEMRGVFNDVRKDRMTTLRDAARNEFSEDFMNPLEAIADGIVSARELNATKDASSILEDAYNIIDEGKSFKNYGFNPGKINDLNQADLFDRIAAARRHLDDNIDYNAIKKGLKSPTPVEKTLMRVRDSLDESLKGGSQSKIESDALYSASKRMEDRFFKIAEDKDGIDEVSLSKLFGNNDRAVKAKVYLQEFEDFANRPDLPEQFRESAKRMADKLKEQMALAEDNRSLWDLSRKTRGVSGVALERYKNITGGNNLVTQALSTPSTFLDTKAQVNKQAKTAFGKGFSELTPQQQKAMVDFLTYKAENMASKKIVSPQTEAKAWAEILRKAGVNGP